MQVNLINNRYMTLKTHGLVCTLSVASLMALIDYSGCYRRPHSDILGCDFSVVSHQITINYAIFLINERDHRYGDVRTYG